MGKSIKAMPKKRGRPATGKDPQVVVRMPAGLIESVQAIAESELISKSDAFRRLVKRGIQAWIEEQR
jgi:hypothetical protein